MWQVYGENCEISPFCDFQRFVCPDYVAVASTVFVQADDVVVESLIYEFDGSLCEVAGAEVARDWWNHFRVWRVGLKEMKLG